LPPSNLGTLAIRERQAAASLEEEGKRVAELLSLGTARLGFVIAAAAILVSGPFLASSADALADQTRRGLLWLFRAGHRHLMLELAVSISAIRVGALNLAIANLLGSNATNMALILPLEVAYGPGSILAVAGPELQTAAATAVLLMAIGTSAIVLKAERARAPFDLAAVLILVGYGFGLWAVYEAKAA